MSSFLKTMNSKNHGLLYCMHQLAWKSFPTVSSQAIRNFLTRIEQDEDKISFFILSKTIPSKPEEWTGSWETKPLPESLFQHEFYQFQLTANPTKSAPNLLNFKPNKDRKDKPVLQAKRSNRNYPIHNHELLQDWFAKKANDGGFQIDDDYLQINILPVRYAKNKIPQHTVEFSGILQVTDREKFIKTFCSGIGSQKYAGFGMLMIVPCKMNVKN